MENAVYARSISRVPPQSAAAREGALTSHSSRRFDVKGQTRLCVFADCQLLILV